MVPKWLKIIRKSPYQTWLLITVEKIQTWDFAWLDIIKMKGLVGIYRCRVGDMRIIFEENLKWEFDILDIGWRGDIYK